MGILQDYFDFVMQYAPYFYYIPGTGVDPEWGRGPAAAAHAIDFLYECYSDSRFASSKTDIYNKIVALADYLLTIQCTNNTKEAYGGFQSKDGSDFYYSIDAHRAIPALLKAYDLTAIYGIHLEFYGLFLNPRKVEMSPANSPFFCF